MLEKISNLPREFWWKILSYILSSLLGPIVSIVLFAHFMAENDFFSYDFFREGLFGMKLFIFTSTMFVAIGAMGIFGWVILIVGKLKGKKVGIEVWSMSVLFFLLVSVFLYILFRSDVDKILIFFFYRNMRCFCTSYNCTMVCTRKSTVWNVGFNILFCVLFAINVWAVFVQLCGSWLVFFWNGWGSAHNYSRF